VRIVLAVLAVVGGAAVPVYLAGWLLIPEEGCEQSLASQFIQSLQARSR
jgi:phage shock protein PspC (stress-responsive transcriptional regulator)